MNDHTRSVSDIFAFNSTLVRLALEDLREEDSRWRMRDGEGSSIHFLVGHLLTSRVAILQMLGQATENPYSEHFGRSKVPAEGSGAPGLGELTRQWDEVAEKLAAVLESLGEEEALAPQQGFPSPDQTVRGALMFRAWHDSYHTGQIGLIRTELGYMALRDRLDAGRKQAG